MNGFSTFRPGRFEVSMFNRLKSMAFKEGSPLDGSERSASPSATGPTVEGHGSLHGTVVHVITNDNQRGHQVAALLLQDKYRVQIFSTSGPFDLLWRLDQYRPAIVLLLVPMDTLTDFSIIREIHRNSKLKGIQVIVIDKEEDDVRRRSAMFFGADCYLAEPVESRRLEALLDGR